MLRCCVLLVAFWSSCTLCFVVSSSETWADKNSENKKKSDSKISPKKKKKKSIHSISQVDVIGRRPSELDSVPGSADVVDKQMIKDIKPLSSSEVFQYVPGVHTYSEDPVGLRLNIGFRGLDPVRSRKVLVLEDGIPVTLAPYGEPDMYYSPTIERMSRLEVIKGSGSILWGPQTIGGVVNMITKMPPKKLTLSGELRYGLDNYFLAMLSVGNTVGKFGYLIEMLHKRFEGPRDLNLVLTDISTKLQIRASHRTLIGIKFHFYDELSSATYLGLTTPQFELDPTQNHAKYDQFPIRRYAISATHKYFMGLAGMIQTSFYFHHITRYWQRQDYERGAKTGTVYERVLDGKNQLNPSAPSDGSGLFFLDSTGNRNREFTIFGVEPRYTLDYGFPKFDVEFTGGLRFHYETADEKYLVGDNARSPAGQLHDYELRGTFAFAAYSQVGFLFLNRKLRIAPGFRMEVVRGERHILRAQMKDQDIKESTFLFAPIPGIGISYEAVQGLTLFTGVHRGFAPPRTKDSITSGGKDLELDPEYSWNWEGGLRFRKKNYLYLQMAAFFMHFESQIIAPSESSGAVADPNGNVINGGKTRHAGAEASLQFDLATLLGWGFQLPLTVSYTYVGIAEFLDGIYTGNRLPYAPEHMLTLNLRFRHPVGFTFGVSGNYVSSQYTDKGMTESPSIDGLVGLIEARFLLDAQISYTFKHAEFWSLGAFLTGKNLLNTVYISSRRPQGIQPGSFRSIMGGLQGTF